MSSAYPSNGGRPVLSCPRCGISVRPDEVRCSNCGLQVPSPNGRGPVASGPTSGVLTGGMNPQGQPPPNWRPGGPPSLVPPERPAGMPQYSPTQPPATIRGQGPLSYPGPPRLGEQMSDRYVSDTFSSSSPVAPSRPFPGSAYAQGASAPSGPSMGTPFGANGLPYQQPLELRYLPDPPVRQRRSKSKLVVGLVLLALLLAVLGIAGFGLLSMQNGTSGTGITSAVPTPHGQALFHDTFANNSNGWDMQSEPGQFAVMVGDGSMKLEDDEHTLLWEVVPGGKTFGNFEFSVDATLLKGDPNNGYGIYIRGGSNQQSQLATYYRFSLYGDGSYAIFKGAVDTNSTSKISPLINYMTSSVIKKQGAVNHITILARGSSLTFIVNGAILQVVTDSSYTSGSIALFVANLQHTQAGAQAAFSQLAIYPY